MFSIVNRSGETIAYLYQNMILNPERDTVIGLVLGNCFFGRDVAPAGKFFRDTFRKTDGEILAKIGEEIRGVLHAPVNTDRLLREAWRMLAAVHDHVCVWVEEKREWGVEDFQEYLLAGEEEVMKN